MCVNVRVCEVSESAGGVGSVLRAHMYIQYICIYSIYYLCFIEHFVEVASHFGVNSYFYIPYFSFSQDASQFIHKGADLNVQIYPFYISMFS